MWVGMKLHMCDFKLLSLGFGPIKYIFPTTISLFPKNTCSDPTFKIVEDNYFHFYSN